MGDPYPVEAGACSYTHIRLANCPYEARYKSLLALLRRDITCEKLVREICKADMGITASTSFHWIRLSHNLSLQESDI